MKLYLVARRDLAPGLRAAQLCHAMRAFAHEHPSDEQRWFTASNTLVLLEVANAGELEALAGLARANGVRTAMFREPDLDYAPTALAIGPEGKRVCRGLSLAFAERRP